MFDLPFAFLKPSNTLVTVLVAFSCFSVGLILWWFKARVDERRRLAGDVADFLAKWGFTGTANALKEYSQGDYSQFLVSLKRLKKAIDTDGERELIINNLLDAQIDNRFKSPELTEDMIARFKKRGWVLAKEVPEVVVTTTKAA